MDISRTSTAPLRKLVHTASSSSLKNQSSRSSSSLTSRFTILTSVTELHCSEDDFENDDQYGDNSDDNNNDDDNGNDDDNDNNTVDDREAEFQAWKRRKEYDPLAAARLHLHLMMNMIMRMMIMMMKTIIQRL